MSAPNDPPIDPVEALRIIRVLINAASDTIEGTAAEPTIREVSRVLDRALPERRRARRKRSKGAAEGERP